MNADRPLALFATGGVVTLVVGAVLARLLGWPAGVGQPPSATGIVALAGLLVVALVAAVAWGVRGTASPERRYW
ncbi:hypothetical protein RYH80_00205 [Halobaculum sp. MBLA0147]|uniref:hypothetical protein n=1 Tax=Halobaculum sp. MBLA0147 TaxID=3079934 RepID=UPI003525314F